MKALKTNILFALVVVMFLLSGTIKAQDCLIHTKYKYIKKKRITTVLKDGYYTTTVEPSSFNVPFNSIWSAVDYDNQGGAFINNQLIVNFKKGTSAAQKETVRGRYKATILEETTFPEYGVELELWYSDFNLLPGITPETKKTTVASDPDIEGVDFNYIAHPDPISVHAIGSSSFMNGTPPPTRVAIIDMGLDENHPLIKNYIVNPDGYDLVNQDMNPHDLIAPHGTHMASNILHHAEHRVSLINLKVFDGVSNRNSLFYIASATYLAVCEGAKVINMSFGWKGAPAACLKDAIEFAGNYNCALVVCSAGNDAVSLDVESHYPSDYNLDNILSVAALNNTGSFAPYTNYGSQVDVAINGAFLGALPKSQIGILEGTSVSTASITGIAGKLYSNNPKAGYKEVKSFIESNTTYVPNCPYSVGCDIALTPSSLSNFDVTSLAIGCEPKGKGQYRLNQSEEQFENDISFTNNKIEISYKLETDSKVEILVADLTGRLILAQANYSALGMHQESISLEHQPTGMYFISLTIDNLQVVKKVIR